MVRVIAWIWNCVGQNNHRHFFLFVVYVWLSSFYGALNVLPLFYEAYNSEVLTLRAHTPVARARE